MKSCVRFAWPLLLLVFSGIAQAEIKASGLHDVCKNWTATYPDKATAPLNIYRQGGCQGFIDGWSAAVAGTLIPDDNGILGTVTFESGVTTIQTAKVFVLYIENHPEEENKPAHVALMHAMLDAKLVTQVSPGKDNGK